MTASNQTLVAHRSCLIFLAALFRTLFLEIPDINPIIKICGYIKRHNHYLRRSSAFFFASGDSFLSLASSFLGHASLHLSELYIFVS